MITISLNQISARNSRPNGWNRILRARRGTSSEVQFPLADVLSSNGLDDVLWALHCLPEHSNLWRKFAVWCARRTQHLMNDQRSIDTLDVAWRHSEGLATDAELAAAEKVAWEATWESVLEGAAAHAAAWAVAWAVIQEAKRAAERAAAAAREAAQKAKRETAWEAERAAQTAKLRQILSAGYWVEDEETTILPDGSAFATISFPLPKDHWLFAEREYDESSIGPKELGKPILTHELSEAVVSAVRYAIRGATNCGKEPDFDPDALVQNAVYALCGPYRGLATQSVDLRPKPISNTYHIAEALDALIKNYDSEIHSEHDGTSMLDSRLSKINFAREALAAYRAAKVNEE